MIQLHFNYNIRRNKNTKYRTFSHTEDIVFLQ